MQLHCTQWRAHLRREGFSAQLDQEVVAYLSSQLEGFAECVHGGAVSFRDEDDADQEHEDDAAIRRATENMRQLARAGAARGRAMRDARSAGASSSATVARTHCTVYAQTPLCIRILSIAIRFGFED